MATAKIQYTISLEQLPDEVKYHLSKLSHKTSDIADLLRSFADNKDFDAIKLANSVEEVRQGLTLLDANLEDCYSILSGYAKYQAQQLQLAQSKKQEKREDESTGGN